MHPEWCLVRIYPDQNTPYKAEYYPDKNTPYGLKYYTPYGIAFVHRSEYSIMNEE